MGRRSVAGGFSIEMHVALNSERRFLVGVVTQLVVSRVISRLGQQLNLGATPPAAPQEDEDIPDATSSIDEMGRGASSPTSRGIFPERRRLSDGAQGPGERVDMLDRTRAAAGATRDIGGRHRSSTGSA